MENVDSFPVLRFSLSLIVLGNFPVNLSAGGETMGPLQATVPHRHTVTAEKG